MINLLVILISLYFVVPAWSYSTPGAEMWDADASAFTSGTYAWVAAGTNTISNDTNSLKVEYGNTATGASDNFNDAADLNANLTVGQWYRYAGDFKVGSGNTVRVAFCDGVAVFSGVLLNNITSFTTYAMTFRARHATNGYAAFASMAAGEIIWADNLSLRPLTLSELITSMISAGSDCHVSVKCTVKTGFEAGIAINIDDPANPQNFNLIYYNSNDSKVYWDKCTTGTYVNVHADAVTYAAGAILEVKKVGSTVTYWYNGSQVYSGNATITTGNYHGTFQTGIDTSETLITNWLSYAGGGLSPGLGLSGGNAPPWVRRNQ